MFSSDPFSPLGGMLENTSYLFGLKTMVLIAALLYLASALAPRFMPLRGEAGETEG